MEQLLVAVSVYRLAADRNAILFQLGERDLLAARAPDRCGPAPPYQTPDDLDQLIASCVSAELISGVDESGDPCGLAQSWVVDPWLADQVQRELETVGRAGDLVAAHRRAAEYWQWRAAAWPQGRQQDLHDLLEARYHLFAAGDDEPASTVTHAVCAQLHAWGDLAQEAELIRSTLDMFSGGTVEWADWTHELGAVYLVRREFDEARRCYGDAVETFSTLGDYDRVARGQHSLGVLAQAEGDYRLAERHYRRSAAAEKKASRKLAAGAEREGESEPAAEGPANTAEGPANTAEGSTNTASTPDERLSTSVEALPPATTTTLATPRPSAQTVTMATGDTRARDGLPRRGIGRVLLALGLTAAAIAVSGGLLAWPSLHLRSGGSGLSPGAVRLAAATWVASQVSRSAVVACDPAMCAALTQRGVPAGDLLTLGPGGAVDPLASNLVVATAALRAEFGERLADVYAPEVLAAFGQGTGAIQVRAVAPDGVPAFAAAMQSDLAARREYGASLLRNSHLLVSAQAEADLANGKVDSRLLAALATIADLQPLRIIAFGDAGPGAAEAVPLRSVVIAPADQSGPGWAHSVLAFLDAQRTPFRPASASWDLVPGDPYALRIQYASPSPLGLLSTQGASQGSPSTHK
jgi:tetratricopeptide (TPR) repeat protein